VTDAEIDFDISDVYFLAKELKANALQRGENRLIQRINCATHDLCICAATLRELCIRRNLEVLQ
jgi:hypothetical protein